MISRTHNWYYILILSITFFDSQGAGYRDEGYILSSEAIEMQHREEYNRITQSHGNNTPLTGTLEDRISSQYNAKSTENEGLDVDMKNLPCIAIYCFEYGNSWWGRWGPSSASPSGGGLGGSEEAVLYISREFAKKG